MSRGIEARMERMATDAKYAQRELAESGNTYASRALTLMATAELKIQDALETYRRGTNE